MTEATGGKNGPKFVPTTQPEPLLRFLLLEQERRMISTIELADAAGIARTTVTQYRHPSRRGGKHPTVAHVRRIAIALGYQLQLHANTTRTLP